VVGDQCGDGHEQGGSVCVRVRDRVSGSDKGRIQLRARATYDEWCDHKREDKYTPHMTAAAAMQLRFHAHQTVLAVVQAHHSQSARHIEHRGTRHTHHF
jgi:hypothetical protein